MNVGTRLKIILGWLAIRTIGQTSKGVKIVTQRGLTSGVMLDYIYQNKPQGSFIIGRYLDKVFLSNPAWDDVRIRKSNLDQYLLGAIALQRELKRSPVLLDIASGAARYVLDLLGRDGMDDVCAICRDLDEDAITLGMHNAAEQGLNSVQFKIADAFDAESLAQIEPKVNIAVSSGFYDWITDDELVQKSISLLFDILPDGGCFLFTNQSRHQTIEFVQAVFPSFEGKRLQMKLRSARQVNGWAEDAGFKIIESTGDKEFSYSVTLAQKPLFH